MASQPEVKEKKHPEKGRGVIRNNESEEKNEKTQGTLEQRIQKGRDAMVRAVCGGAHTCTSPPSSVCSSLRQSTLALQSPTAEQL